MTNLDNLEKIATWLIIILAAVLAALMFYVLFSAGEESGDNACKDIGYRTLTGNSLSGYYCLDESDAIAVVLQCGLDAGNHNCHVHKVIQ